MRSPRAAAVLLLAAVASGCLARVARPPQFAPALLPPSLGGAARGEPSFLDPGAFYARRGGEAASHLAFDLSRAWEIPYLEGDGGTAFSVEVTEWSSPLEAYGFREAIAGDAVQVSSGPLETGFAASSVYVFSQGRLVVRILPGSRDLAGDGAAGLAASLSGVLPAEPVPPREVLALASAGVDRAGIVYSARPLPGSLEPGPGLRAALPSAYGEGVLFLAVKPSAGEAARAMQDYLLARSAGRLGVGYELGVGELAASLRDAELGWIALARSGRYVTGVAGVAGPFLAWPLLSRILTSLGE